MATYRVLALEPLEPSMQGDDDIIDESVCMVEKLNNADTTYGNSRRYQGNTFYALYPRLLETAWLQAMMEAIQLNKIKSKFIIVRR